MTSFRKEWASSSTSLSPKKVLGTLEGSSRISPVGRLTLNSTTQDDVSLGKLYPIILFPHRKGGTVAKELLLYISENYFWICSEVECNAAYTKYISTAIEIVEISVIFKGDAIPAEIAFALELHPSVEFKGTSAKDD